MEYRIIPRSEWGARHDNGSGYRKLPATEVWLHHSVTVAPDLIPPFDDDYDAIRTLEQIGEDRFGSGISYTWLITPAGLIFEGHSPDRIGTHTQNHNTVGSAICYVGNYDVSHPTVGQVNGSAWLLQQAKAHNWIKYNQITGGHRDLKSTACPGVLAYQQIPTINALAAGPPIVAAEPVIEEDEMIVGQFPLQSEGWVSIPFAPLGNTDYTKYKGGKMWLGCGWGQHADYEVFCVSLEGNYTNADQVIPYVFKAESDRPGFFYIPTGTALVNIHYRVSGDPQLPIGYSIEFG